MEADEFYMYIDEVTMASMGLGFTCYHWKSKILEKMVQEVLILMFLIPIDNGMSHLLFCFFFFNTHHD